MTLRENTSETAHRKYSVSQSGKYKSRPKIRPALSGDLFRPDLSAELTAKTNTIDLNERNREGSVGETCGRDSGTAGNQMQQKQGRQSVPGEVIETAL
ncbi:uncharacterized protein LOC129734096 [Wyeomyia smithii]|uniref:uncharacterized protein LOC129734096 n=1 Tax=Wyeomyia smithii TaxID=174621 RepID=UPI002467E774|nr:uncharacterized protein LOC129734096 [Wyeomyia smithii]